MFNVLIATLKLILMINPVPAENQKMLGEIYFRIKKIKFAKIKKKLCKIQLKNKTLANKKNIQKIMKCTVQCYFKYAKIFAK